MRVCAEAQGPDSLFSPGYQLQLERRPVQVRSARAEPFIIRLREREAGHGAGARPTSLSRAASRSRRACSGCSPPTACARGGPRSSRAAAGRPRERVGRRGHDAICMRTSP